jgi:hypothetical protein
MIGRLERVTGICTRLAKGIFFTGFFVDTTSIFFRRFVIACCLCPRLPGPKLPLGVLDGRYTHNMYIFQGSLPCRSPNGVTVLPCAFPPLS